MSILTSLRTSISSVLALALGTGLLSAQNTQGAPDTLPPTNQALFAPLALPPASPERTGAGEPGHAYWQQRADYSIRATLDPQTHSVTGSEVIHYTNHSPDDLDELWLQLDQNLFAPRSRGSVVNPSNRWRGSFSQGGVKLHRVEVVAGGRRYTPEYFVNDTRMRIALEEALAARGGVLDVEIEWSFVIPEYGADRMGRLRTEAGWVYELAQWYPRMYVYDDVDGWNPMPYLGQGEFYLEYGDFDVEITAPGDLTVVAGGRLLNPEEVLSPERLARYRTAQQSDTTVHIIRPDEVPATERVSGGASPRTWKFRLENARDFSWAASRAFIWDASSWNDVLLQSAYPKEGIGSKERPGWEHSTEYIRHTISFYSEHYFPFPYPAAVNVAGIVGGMEYPGIVFCSVRARGQGLFGVTDHEFGHSWFPMIVGSDERRYAWMDEGFNTFINYYSNKAFFGEAATRSARTQPAFIARRMQEPIADQPIMTYPDLLRREGLGFLGYRKPGFGLILLREWILGPERFDPAFRAYVKKWAFKHPKPADFFRAMEDAAGEELDWFWRGWFYSTDVLDQSVGEVSRDDEGVSVRLDNLQGLVMPAEVEVEMPDGRVFRRRLPVEIWILGNTYRLHLNEEQLPKRVTLDPDGRLPDINPGNNTWTAAPIS
ncbi:MAG: M1 family metallopeptidase [Gemmatimonadota bacterium]